MSYCEAAIAQKFGRTTVRLVRKLAWLVINAADRAYIPI